MDLTSYGPDYLACACAWNYTRTAPAPLRLVRKLRLELARSWPAPRLPWLADSKGFSVSPIKCLCSTTTLRMLAASIERARIVGRPPTFEVSAAASELFL